MSRAAILRHVRANPGVKPKDIAEALPGIDADTIRRACSRMVEAGQLAKDGSGRYYPDTDTRTETTPEVSQLSDCPVTPADQHARPAGRSETVVTQLVTQHESGPVPSVREPGLTCVFTSRGGGI
jgi:hypothetical protein